MFKELLKASVLIATGVICGFLAVGATPAKAGEISDLLASAEKAYTADEYEAYKIGMLETYGSFCNGMRFTRIGREVIKAKRYSYFYDSRINDFASEGARDAWQHMYNGCQEAYDNYKVWFEAK